MPSAAPSTLPDDAGHPVAPRLLSAHFALVEFTHSQTATRLGLDNTPGPVALANLRRLAARLELVRKALNASPITITSGFRSLTVNRAVGSADTSAHTQGLAADFVCRHYGTPRNVCRRLVDAGISFDQLIDEHGWVHLSVAEPGERERGQLLTAIFTPGRPTRYQHGLAGLR